MRKRQSGRDIEPWIPQRTRAVSAKTEFVYVNTRKRALCRLGILALSLALLLGGFWLWNRSLSHIPDCNGPEDYALATLTDAELLALDSEPTWLMSVKDKTHELQYRAGTAVASKNFSGVYELFRTNYAEPTDFEMNVRGFNLYGGNFKMAVVNNGEVIAEIEPGLYSKCALPGLTGEVSLRIAGESAEFVFLLDKQFCKEYDIDVLKDHLENAKAYLQTAAAHISNTVRIWLTE